jgi:hypothetical protein
MKIQHSKDKLLKKKHELDLLKLKAYSGMMRSSNVLATPIKERQMRRAATDQGEVGIQ